MAKRKKQRRQYQRPQGQPAQPRREREAPAPAAPAGWSTARKAAVAAAAIAAGVGIFVAVVLTQGSKEPTVASPSTTTAVTTTPTGTSPQDLAKRFGPLTGKRLFAVYCGVCHTLADAGAQGTDGPDLDLVQPSKARVLRAIRRGGTGSGLMPAHIFRGARAARIAAYVARATHPRG